MSYFEPYIGAEGIRVPTYKDILEHLLQCKRDIFGQDIYLGVDSQDYEEASIFALKLSHTYDLLVGVYNNRGPSTAVGSALDGLVKLNGLKRLESSYSTCVVILTGEPSKVLTNLEALDVRGTTWVIPSVSFGIDGSARVTAQVNVLGQIPAAIGEITQIKRATLGWYSITNEEPAVLGKPVEYDHELRRRQADSTALPSQTLLEGTEAALVAVPGVNRRRVYENDTNDYDHLGLPPHSITCVVEGGLEEAICEAIVMHKGIGCYTSGDVRLPMRTVGGSVMSIGFFRPKYVAITVEVNFKPLQGYSSDLTNRIRQSIEDYLGTAKIGEPVMYSSVWAAALKPLLDIKAPTYSLYSVKLGYEDSSQVEVQDIALDFNEVSIQGTIVIREVTK